MQPSLKYLLKGVILLFCSHFILVSLYAQSKEQKKLIKEIKNNSNYYYVEESGSSARNTKMNAKNKLFAQLKNESQFNRITNAIKKGLALPENVNIATLESSSLSVAEILWKKSNKYHVLLYLEKHEAIEQLATGFTLSPTSLTDTKWFLGQAIHSNATVSNQLAANDLASIFGVVTKSTQKYFLAENNDSLLEQYSKQITQQRTVLLSGQKQMQINWSPNLTATYMAISQTQINKIDKDLAIEIDQNVRKAEAFLTSQEIDKAWYAFYKAYLFSLLRFESYLIKEQNAEDYLSNAMQLLVNKKLQIATGKAYLLNEETVVIPLIVTSRNSANLGIDLAYQDYTGSTYTKILGGKANLYLKSPSSISKELVIPIKLSMSLNEMDKKDGRISLIDNSQKGWINYLLKIELSTVQRVQLKMNYNIETQEYEFIPELKFIEELQVEWLNDQQYYIGNKLKLKAKELTGLNVAVRINEEPDWVYTAQIDTIEHRVMKSSMDVKFLGKQESLPLPAFYSFMNEITNTTVLLSELARQKNLGKLNFGNLQSMPSNQSLLLIAIDKSLILKKWYLYANQLYELDDNRLKLTDKVLQDLLADYDQMLWFKKVEKH